METAIRFLTQRKNADILLGLYGLGVVINENKSVLLMAKTQ